MASSTRIPKAQLTGSYGALVKRMPRKMFGEVANLMTRANTALGVESQEFSGACGLEPLALPATR